MRTANGSPTMSETLPMAGAATTPPIERELPTAEFQERRWFWSLLTSSSL